MTLGLVGGGQLGRMLAEAAKSLGIRTVVLDPTPDSPAGQVADAQIVGDFTNYDAVYALSKECEVMTFEIESANEEALERLAREGMPVHPTPATLTLIKDKLQQKRFLYDKNIPVAPFMDIQSEADAREAGERFGYPFVLKARFGAYDGRGNATIHAEDEIPASYAALGGKNLYAEGWVQFDKELAVVAVRSIAGDIRTYPVVETIHKNHICDTVLMPAPIPHETAVKAEALAATIMEVFAGAGVFGIEMFLAGDEVLINEIAPRVHNSGHVTIEACETSQFENHVRAVCGRELGSTAMKVPAAVMINILGERNGPATPQGVAEAESLGSVAVHIYGKKETKVARKMGHLTVTGASLMDVLATAKDARSRVSI